MSQPRPDIRARLEAAWRRFRAWRPSPELIEATRKMREHAREVADEIADEHAESLVNGTDPDDIMRICISVYMRVVAGLPLEAGGPGGLALEQALGGLAALGTGLVLAIVHARAQKRLEALEQAGG